MDFNINSLGKQVAYNFPSLKSIEFFFSFYKLIRDSHFKTANKIEMICIHPINKYKNKTESEFLSLFHEFLSQKTVYYNYPFKQEGWLSGLYYQGNYFYLDDKTNEVKKSLRKINDDILSTIRFLFSKKKGIALDEFNIFCEIYPFKCYAKNQDGTLAKIYDDRAKFFPFEVTSLNSIIPSDFDEMKRHYDILKKNYETPMKEFPIKSNVALLTKKNFGMVGKVERYILNTDKDFDNLSNKNCTEYYDLETNYDITQEDYFMSFKQFYKGPLLEVSVNEFYQLSPITDSTFTKAITKNTKDSYLSLEFLAKELKIDPIILGIITSNCLVVNCSETDENAKISELQNWNIGLNMKGRMKNQNMILPGFTRSTYEEHFTYEQSLMAWEFSDKAVEIIKEYIEKFQIIFDCFGNYLNFIKSARFFRIHELFANVDNIEKRLNDLLVWINSTSLNKVSFAPSTSNFLSQDVIENIKATVFKKTAELSSKNKLFSSKMYLNPNYCFAENTPWTPMFLIDSPQNFELGDRVVNICSSDKKYAPFGLKGTVSGVAEDYIEVIFDQVFFGGSTLNGRVSEKTGVTINPLSLINLTRYFKLNL